MPARGLATTPRLSRYVRRFGGTGTIVALGDGRAVTAAHCIAAVDGRPGTVIACSGGRWEVIRRWAPSRLDLAVLARLERSSPSLLSGRRGRAPGVARALSGVPHRPNAPLASRVEMRLGAEVVFVGYTGKRFQRRRALVTSLSDTTAIAVVRHPRGVCGNDSGGPVFVGDRLVGVVTHRMGPPISPRGSSRCSSHVVFTRLDSPSMRATIAAAFERAARTTHEG